MYPQEAAGGGDGGAMVAVAAAYSPRMELALRIDKRVLHCPFCTLSFKPPVLQVLLFLSFFLPHSVGAGEGQFFREDVLIY
jgi:hypothetical protein